MSMFLSHGLASAGHMIVRTEPSGLSAARRHIQSVAKQLDIGEDEASDIILAVGEAISNAYRHGTSDPDRGYIYLDWCFAEDTFTVAIKDDGPGVFETFRPFAGDLRPGAGAGFYVMRRSVDDVRMEFDSGTRITLKKRCNLPLTTRS